jgi:hypothetical protein
VLYDLEDKVIQLFEISEAVYQSTRPEPQMFGIFIKTAVRSSKCFISATASRQRKNKKIVLQWWVSGASE